MKSVLSLFIVLFLAAPTMAYRPITEGRLKELVESFQYVPTVVPSITANATCNPSDIKYTTTYPERETELTIDAKAFVPAEVNTKVPLVVILPPIGGANKLDVLMGEVFCQNKIAAILITTNLTGLDSPTLVPVTDHDHTHRRVAAAIKGAIIIGGSYSQIETTKIGLFGVSLGGILGSVAYSVLPEISAATFVVNGGDVPHILANSDQGLVVKLKRLRMQEQGFTSPEQYENYLNQNIEIDPIHFAKMIQPETIKLYLATKDKSVPSVSQMAYYEALGKPENTKFYAYGHAETIFGVMAMGPEKQNIADWFKSRFAIKNPRLEE
jgi:hypothetical protein